MKRKIISVLAVVFVMFFAMTPTASAAEKITFKEYTDEGKYYFYYPDICSVSWNSVQPYLSSQQFVSATCPPGHGFTSYEIIYGSGDRSETIDQDSRTFAADGVAHQFAVQITPHQQGTGLDLAASYWTNFKVIPQF